MNLTRLSTIGEGVKKKYARENCGYSIEALHDILPLALNSITPELIGKYYQKNSAHYSSISRLWYTVVYGSEDFKKVYKSHRRVGME